LPLRYSACMAFEMAAEWSFFCSYISLCDKFFYLISYFVEL
jgi:hypothetical protein